ncbi:hypothetical protein [Spiroplasma sp. DGKH1]|uniref:hypothetical protein n=1 Tax=Spiroplasma sp. DGKH1 TaxID=3050074 RepID=UPI0034C62393
MSLKRLLASFLNMIFCWLNLILWIFNIDPIGTLATGISVPSTRKGKLIFGASALLQWIITFTIIGTVVVIVMWVLDKPSIATIISGAVQ